jgi:hypothetical protein
MKGLFFRSVKSCTFVIVSGCIRWFLFTFLLGIDLPQVLGYDVPYLNCMWYALKVVDIEYVVLSSDGDQDSRM